MVSPVLARVLVARGPEEIDPPNEKSDFSHWQYVSLHASRLLSAFC